MDELYPLVVALKRLGWNEHKILAEFVPPDMARSSKKRKRAKLRRWLRLEEVPWRYKDAAHYWGDAVVEGEEALHKACLAVAHKVLGHAETKIDTLTGVQAIDGLKKLVEVMAILRTPSYAGAVMRGDLGPDGRGLLRGTGSIGLLPPGVDAVVENTLERLSTRIMQRVNPEEEPTYVQRLEAMRMGDNVVGGAIGSRDDD